MKKLMFNVFAILATINLFTSCAKDDITTTADLTTTDITTELLGNTDLFGAVTDLEASARGGGGDDDFKPKKLKKISVDSLSDIIKTYVATNYPNSTIKDAFLGKNGETIIIVTKEDGKLVGVLFDAKGAFVKEVKNEKNNGNGKGKDLTEVDVKKLSTAITTYISSNYAGATTLKAVTDAKGNFYVLVKKADGTLVGLEFDASGVFQKVLDPKGKGILSPVDALTLIKPVVDYVNTNYPNSKIVKAYNDKDGNIIVSITTSDKKEVRILFDAKGAFVSVFKKK
jgi:hypothetical protein